ncbi:ATP-binding region ATPase domain protein [Desulfobulbus propionicus DSM 2032]|jgi:anti-sigma regulatory factor (Ser/Thr protein kinase)|uniref:ATP-binding region ATPase domain protein n=1 Tax=Desulfobulbus propionicus (strain ATCC 33891 / DSM 2032 / VKM B-1956 / 1pr3) TaxID=577650 RepID=A0A7U4DQR8_DESPD|nr:ATP-binding protein [Desulfobulbus propionicus]ADW19302.1 ATP-binding region ATPase domain protein [Desulfobulbus propionicus DSM 2032]
MSVDTFRVAARVERLAEAIAFVEDKATHFGLGPNKRFGLTLALEEAFVNICHHAYPDGQGEAELACDGDGDAFVLEIVDSGVPFDLLSLPEPDRASNISERAVGGLGVHFIRTFADSVRYHREGGRNILRITFNRG